MLRIYIERLPIGWAGRLALQRLLSQWRSLLTIIAGVLLSAAVGALVPLYTTAVAQVGMVEKFNQLPADQVNASAHISLVASENKDFDGAVNGYDAQFRDITDKRLSQNFPGWINRIVFFGETSALDVMPAQAAQGDPQAEPTSRALVAYYDGWQDSLPLVAGRLPTDNAEQGADIEIAVPLEVQRTQNVNVGDVLLLVQGGLHGGWPSSKPVHARVVGVANAPEQQTAVQRAYLMSPSPLRVDKGSGNYTAEFPILTTRAAFEKIATQFVPDTPTLIGWRVLLDHTKLPFSRSPDARQALFDYDHDLKDALQQKSDLQFVYATSLINWQQQGAQNVDTGAMLAYERSVRSLDAPFGLLLLQVGALVIFFLLVTAALVRRGERREIAMLQSRGAMNGQIIAIRGLESLAICVLAALIAPIISQQLLILIAPFFARDTALTLQLSPSVFAYSFTAALMAFIALMFTLRPVLDLPLITSGGTTLRSERQLWWQRYYLDVLLVVLGIAALWRLVGKDTPLFTTTAGARTTDPFLLLAPALLFLGLGSILLRLFPVIAGLTARILTAGRGLVGPLATWQLSREPIHYGRITFLLALAIGIGWFATSFRATVNRSQGDQARYKVGTDIRYDERDLTLNAGRARPDTAYTQIPGVAAASVSWRYPSTNFQADATKPPLFTELLAVDSATFQRVYYWRPDLGSVGLPNPAAQPVALPERGVALPFVPQKLNLWAEFTVRGPLNLRVPDLDRLRQRVTIFARLLDNTGAWIRVPFKVTEVEYASTGPQMPGVTGGGSFRTDGWAYLEADLSTLTYKPVAPMNMVSFYWQHRGPASGGERDLHLTLAGLSATDSSGKQQPLDLFNSPDWQFAYDSGARSQGSISSGFVDDRRGTGITIAWDQSAAAATLGATINYPDLPSGVPLIVSSALAAQMAAQPGQTVKVPDLEQLSVTFKVVGNQKYYPTLYDSFVRDGQWVTDDVNHPFAIADRDQLLYVLNKRPSAALYADEVWIKAAPGADISAIVNGLRQPNTAIVGAETLPGELANLQTDPLNLGLLGLMLLAFIIAMSLSVVGLLTYSALTAVARRSEFGVLQALGMSPMRVIGQLAFEQIFVIVLGVALGGILGAMLSNQVVPRLALDTSSKNITPPFIVQVETGALVQYGVVIFVVLALVLASTLVLIRQLSLSQTLRLGEE